MWLKQSSSAVSVGIGSSLFVKYIHAERSHNAKSSDCNGKDLFWDLTKVAQMKTAADSSVVQHSFIYFCLEINFNPFKIDKGTFLSCWPVRSICPNHYIYTSPIASWIFLDKVVTSPFWKNSIHASIINNSIAAFKQEKKN